MKLNLPKIKKINLPKITLKPINIPKPKIDMKALQKSVGYITDIVSIVPFMRPIITGAKVGINVATKGESGRYLKDDQKSNSGWNMAPGGALLQRSLNDITNGKSGTWIEKNTIDLNKIGLAQVNKLPPKYNPTKIIPTMIQGSGKNTLSRPIERRIKPSLISMPTNYISPSTLSRNNPILDLGMKSTVLPIQPVLPPYQRISIDKEIVNSPPIEIKEVVSTLSNSVQPTTILPKIDKFNRIESKIEIIEKKNENIDMTLPIMTLAGIFLIMYMRK